MAPGAPDCVSTMATAQTKYHFEQASECYFSKTRGAAKQNQHYYYYCYYYCYHCYYFYYCYYCYYCYYHYYYYYYDYDYDYDYDYYYDGDDYYLLTTNY